MSREKEILKALDSVDECENYILESFRAKAKEYFPHLSDGQINIVVELMLWAATEHTKLQKQMKDKLAEAYKTLFSAIFRTKDK